MKKSYVLLTIILLALFVRVIYLKEVPPGIANDEINIILNAQSISKVGQNIPGVVTGVLGNPAGDLSGGIHSEISSYLLTPILFITGFNWPQAKLPFVIFGLGLILLSFLLVRKLINQETALIAAALSAINPWSIHFSRSAYESIISCFFYLLAIYFIITKKSWEIFYSLPFFLLGFLSYFSAKTLLIPLALSSILAVKFLKDKESLKPVIFLNLCLVLFLILYGFILSTSAGGQRIGELKNDPQVQRIVNDKRTKSIDLPFTKVFENKYTENITQRLSASFSGLSLNFLFIDGKEGNNPALSIPEQSPMYLIDFPLIILGIVYLSRSNLAVLIFLISLVTTTLIPNFLNLQGTTFMIRTVILFPLLTILSASGVYYIIRSSKGLVKIFVTTLIILIYLFYFGNFVYRYFGRLPIDRAEGWFLHQRVAISYIKNFAPNHKLVAVVPSPKHFFYRFLFFSGVYTNSQSIRQINRNLGSKNYTFSNLEVTGICLKDYDPNITYLVSKELDCPSVSGIYIANIRDGGDQYLIVNDKLCNLYVKRTYPLIKEYKYLNVEGLSKIDLCNNFVTTHER